MCYFAYKGTIKREKIKIKFVLILFSERKYLRGKASMVRLSERFTKFADKREQRPYIAEQEHIKRIVKFI